jgi:membrane protease YdiL (CAAX protease family)
MEGISGSLLSQNHRLVIAFAVVTFVGLLSLSLLLKPVLNDFLKDEILVELLAGSMARLAVCGAGLLFVIKADLPGFLGLGKRRPENLQALIIPLTIVGAVIVGGFETYTSAPVVLLLFFMLKQVLVAMAEELFFRGIVLPKFILLTEGYKNGLILSVVLTSVIFGLLHFINLIRQPDNLYGITTQVIFATSMGVFLAGLFLRTRSISIPILFHFLFNVAFGKSELEPNDVSTATEIVAKDPSLSSFILTLSFFAFIAIGGIYMIRTVDRQLVFDTLKNSDSI